MVEHLKISKGKKSLNLVKRPRAYIMLHTCIPIMLSFMILTEKPLRFVSFNVSVVYCSLSK